MKLILQKKRCKAAVVMLNGRLNFHTTEVTPVELLNVKRLLEETYLRKVEFVSHKTRKDRDNPDYKDISETKLSDYDEVYIFNTGVNVFGGVFNYACLQTFKQLLDFKGTIYYVLSDPRFPCKNIAHYMRKKLVKNGGFLKTDNKKDKETKLVTFEDCDKYTNEVFPNIITAFNGFDYELFLKQYAKKHRKMSPAFVLPQKHDWCEFTYFQFFGKKLLDDKSLQLNFPYEGKKYDLCYYGVNRRNERNLLIADLYSPASLSKLFIGFDGVKLDNMVRIERTAREDLFSTIAKNCLATLVIADNYHNNNCITFRFYEAMLLDCVALIYSDFDTERKLVENEFLKEFIYIKTKEDVEDRIKRLRESKELYEKVIKLQRKEIHRLLKDYDA